MEEKVTIVLNAKEFNTIMLGLGELPHKVSAPVVSTLVSQVQAQVDQNGAPKKE